LARLRVGLFGGVAVGGVGCFLAHRPARAGSKNPASPRRPLLSVAAGAQTLSQRGGKTPQLVGLRFVARAPLTCGQADALPCGRLGARSYPVSKIKTASAVPPAPTFSAVRKAAIARIHGTIAGRLAASAY